MTTTAPARRSGIPTSSSLLRRVLNATDTACAVAALADATLLLTGAESVGAVEVDGRGDRITRVTTRGRVDDLPRVGSTLTPLLAKAAGRRRVVTTDDAGTSVAVAVRCPRQGLLGVVVASHVHHIGGPERLVEFVDLASSAIGLLVLVERAERGPSMEAYRRLAAELHDGVAQDLFAARLEVDDIQDSAAGLTQVLAAADRAQTRLQGANRSLRATLHRMADGWTDRLTTPGLLTAALNDVIADARARHAVDVELTVVGDGNDPARDGAEVLLRSVREGLANVVKHSEAAQVSVCLRRGERWCSVEVADDGIGDPATVRRELISGGKSFGLSSLAADAAGVGGRLWVDRDDLLRGMLLVVAVPLEEDHVVPTRT